MRCNLSRQEQIMSRKKLVEDIKQDPAHFYRQPSDVMRDRRFTDAERLEILSAWEDRTEGEERAKVREVQKQTAR
jgi:hypothetical protein